MVTVSKELQQTLQAAVADARKRRHEYVTLEHLLHALCADKVASEVLVACSADLPALTRELEDYLTRTLEALPQEEDPEQTAAFQRVLQRAAWHVQGAGRSELNGGDVLVALTRERGTHAVYLLEKQGVRRIDILQYLSHGVTKDGEGRALPGAGGTPGEGEGEGDEEGPPQTVKDPFRAFTVNLVERAAKGQIDPLVGRDAELERTIQVLCRRRKNNPVFVGDPGVGKTAIVEGLALRIHEKKVPAILAGCAIYSLDMGSLLAGTKFRGEFEQRLKGVIAGVKKLPGAILFIDEIHTIVGAGATSGSSMDASNLLKPSLASGELRCIGSTTYSDYKATFERDHALARRFQKIEVGEPTVEDTIKILKGLKKVYEDHHGVEYSARALRAAAELSAKHINDRKLPDKAIDVLDEAGARDRMRAEEKRHHRITARDVERVVARIAKIPERTVSADDRSALQSLEPELKKVIFGQDPAIEAIASAIKLGRSGLGSPEKPTGCFLFSGPTGVGKTELAKQLARILGVEFLRFDMTEYQEKHTVSRLIGAPPGYVGFDQGGLLTDAVRKTPYAARRDREGPPRRLQPAAAGDGPRHPHRQQRAQGRLPQRGAGDDHQRRGPGAVGPPRRLRRRGPGAGQRQERHRARLQPGVPQPARRLGLLRLAAGRRGGPHRRQVRGRPGRAAPGEEGEAGAGPGRTGLVRRARLRSQDGRPPHGPPHPARDQEAAGREDPLR
jgi:ATP-dependent Clp protease ATP-binding subunit ClpA